MASQMTTIPLDGELRDGRHTFIVRVYYEDTDFTGIVYHANYLRYMERGRTNYLRLIGADHRVLFEQTEKEAPGFAFVVRSMTLDFLKPARMDDILTVISEPNEVKGASVTIRQRVMRGDELLVQADVRVAFISGAAADRDEGGSGRGERLTASFRRALDSRLYRSVQILRRANRLRRSQ
jgi:acyl-CoA thioester hydrolase